MTWISGDCRVGRHSRCALPESCSCTHHLPTVARLRYELANLDARIEPLLERREAIVAELDRAAPAKQRRATSTQRRAPACKRCGRLHEPRHSPGRYPALCAECKVNA